MVDPLIQYNRMPPPLDPESSTAHLDGELSRLERTTSQVIQRVTEIPALYAPLASPTLTGDPKAPTPTPGDNDTSIATTAFVTAADAVVTAAYQAADAAEVTARNNAINTAVADKVVNTRLINAGTGLSGGGNLTADRTLALADTVVTPGSYDRASITVDQQGRITAASSGEAPTWTTLFKGADQAITSNITPADLTGLSFAADASSTYVVRFVLFWTQGAGGARVDMNSTSAPTLGFRSEGFISGSAVTHDSDATTVAGTGNYAVEYHAYFTTNAATTISVRGAQQVANAAATTFLKGSYIEYRKIA